LTSTVTNTNGKHRTMATIATTLVAAGIVALIAWAVDIAGWRGGVDAALIQEEQTARNVNTALQVLGDHGSELSLVRHQIENLRGEMSATRTEILGHLDRMSGDRFRGEDWRREHALINMRFQRLEERMDEVLERLK
jgi:hypothetical protein